MNSKFFYHSIESMKRIIYVFGWIASLFLGGLAQGQSISGNRVNFQVTYDAVTDRYTAWVVPQYNVPNMVAPINNTGTTEFGGTAQFTIKAPVAFSVSDIQDVNGVWDKTPLRLGPGVASQTWLGLDPLFNYWVIGKSPQETNYGSFKTGVPVRLFTFKGNGCFGPVSPLPAGDPFIGQANSQASLNVANSFYSRSGQPTGGNVLPLEQFANITGPAADCRPIGAVADSGTLLAGTTTTLNVLANDTNNGGPASITNVTVTLSGAPASGTAVVNSNGTISYTPAPGFTGPVSFSYTICDRTVTTRCSSAGVSLTVRPAPATQTDLSLSKRVSVPAGQTVAIGATISFSVVVMNLGPAVATNVVITDQLPANLSLVSSAASLGGYVSSTGLWTIASLSVNQSATLVVTTRVLDGGSILNQAAITRRDQPDPNPDNDIRSACVTVPIPLCSTELLQLSIPSQYQQVRWFFNGQLVQGVTSNTLIVGTPGTYTFEAVGTNCPVTGCCPIVVVDGNCCKPICIPVAITKRPKTK
jgi:uncharacterized repeat protein (TIGR01451 family)